MIAKNGEDGRWCMISIGADFKVSSPTGRYILVQDFSTNKLALTGQGLCVEVLLNKKNDPIILENFCPVRTTYLQKGKHKFINAP